MIFRKMKNRFFIKVLLLIVCSTSLESAFADDASTVQYIDQTPERGENITVIDTDERTGLSRETYTLKGGYTLIIEPTIWKCSDGRDESSCRVCLQKGNTVRVIANMLGYLNHTRYAPRYEGTDFDDYFVLTYYFDGYNHYLIEKQTGKTSLSYTGGTADTEHSLLIYSPKNKNSDDWSETVFLRDLRTQKDYDLMPYIDREMSKGTYAGVLWWRDAFEIVSASLDSVKIRYWGYYDWKTEKRAEFTFTVKK